MYADRSLKLAKLNERALPNSLIVSSPRVLHMTFPLGQIRVPFLVSDGTGRARGHGFVMVSTVPGPDCRVCFIIVRLLFK